MKNKRAMEGGMWWLIVGAIAALFVGAVVLYIVQGGLFTGKRNIDLLGSCKNQGGQCKEKGGCDFDETEFLSIGCPFAEDASGKLNNDEKNKVSCCISKERKGKT